jgi:sugar lactone lactonase YvrE
MVFFTMDYFVLILLQSHIVSATALGSPTTIQGRDFQPRSVHQFPNETWVENLYIRSNGDILATVLSSSDLYLIDPFKDSKDNAVLLDSFPGSMGLAGITEIKPNVYAVIAGNWSDVIFATTPGSYSVWEVDLTCYKNKGKDNGVEVRKIADMPQAGFLNGMIPLGTEKEVVLISDAYLGVIWKLDTKTGEYEVILDEPEMKDAPNPVTVLGVNGIKLRQGFLYFTCSTQEIFARVAINADGTKKVGTKVELLATGIFGDDFALDRDGNAWIAADPVNTLYRVTLDGKVTIVLGSPTGGRGAVAGITAAQFGVTQKDRDILYLTSNGGIPSLINEGAIVGGKIIAVDTKSLNCSTC